MLLLMFHTVNAMCKESVELNKGVYAWLHGYGYSYCLATYHIKLQLLNLTTLSTTQQYHEFNTNAHTINHHKVQYIA